MKLILVLTLFIPTFLFSQEKKVINYKEDFLFFWNTINDYYSYFDKKQTDWQKVKALYAPQIDTVTTRSGFIHVLERVLYELYDHHASLNTNTMSSHRLVPSGTDIWAEYANGKAWIVSVRFKSPAADLNLQLGTEIIEFNGVPIEKAIVPFLPKSLRKDDIEAKNFALRTLIAGAHNGNRKIRIRSNDKTQEFELPTIFRRQHPPKSVEWKVIKGNIGYIIFNDRLWDNTTIGLFDSAMQRLKNTSSLILDMRNTPSGGNTTVARAIIGRFIGQEGYYQKHELPFEERKYGVKRSWTESVTPMDPVYKNPVVLLVDRWTGSVGEGITIGFDGLKRARIIGTKMAGLNGANYSFTMPSSGIGFSFPAEKLFHVNGTPREDFIPDGIVPSIYIHGNDPFIAFAISYLTALK